MIGTDAVAALEANLDRCPTMEQLWQLLTQGSALVVIELPAPPIRI
jgi:hypothetical protein